jgi:hypothetical protein
VDTLRSKLIRLAHQNPALRPHLLPILKEAGISTQMETYLKGIFEGGGRSLTKPIPKKTYQALAARGLVTGGEGVSPLITLTAGLVSATLTDKGKELAIDLFRKEHAERLSQGQKSERIPRLLRTHGVDV